MRRNDAPGESGDLAGPPAAGPDVPRRRPDDDHLRQRLAGLRASHPSSPEYRDREAAPEWDEAEAEPGGGSPRGGTAGHGADHGVGDIAAGRGDMTGWYGQSGAADGERDEAGSHDGAGGHDGAVDRAGAAEPDGSGHGRGPAEGNTGGLPGPDGGPPGPGDGPHGEPGQARPGHGGPARPVPMGGGEPYRPWFSSGEPLEPWFTGDPGDPPG
jgi:hypothetical protein